MRGHLRMVRPAGQTPAPAAVATPTAAGTYQITGTLTMPDGTVAPPGATATTDGAGNVTITSAAGVQLYNGPEPQVQPGTQSITATTPAQIPWGWVLGGAVVGGLITGAAMHYSRKRVVA